MDDQTAGVIGDLVNHVRGLWPRGGVTAEQVRVHWEAWLGRHHANLIGVKNALSRQYGDGDERPNWKALRGVLSNHGHASHTDDPITRHCGRWRKAASDPRFIGSDRRFGSYSDEQAWMAWLDAQSYATQFDTLTGFRREDADGKRAAEAARIRAGECRIMLADCKAEGVDPPDWFARSWMPGAVPC